jgi:HEAT repeat protein
MSKLKSILAAVFNLRPGEGGAVALLVAMLFAQACGLTVLNAAANALFLTRFKVEYLPYVYLAAAFISPVVAILYSKLEARLSQSKLLVLSYCAMFGIVAAVFGFLTAFDSNAIVMALMILKDPLGAVALIAAWSLVGSVFDVRQGKRLFGMIGAGQILAGIVAGFSTPLLVSYLGATNLLVVSALALVIALVPGVLTVRHHARNGRNDDEEEEEDRTPLLHLVKDRYLGLLFGTTLLSFCAIYFMEYFFYGQAESRFTDEAQLASFFGIFSGVAGAVTLLSNSFLSGRLLVRYGLTFGLLAVPVILIVCLVPTAIVGSFPGTIGIFFWMIVVTKLLDEVFRNAAEDPSVMILYQPLSPGVRVRAQTVVEAIVDPVAGGLSGIVLLVFAALLGMGPVPLVYLTVALVGGAIFVAVRLRKEYTRVLTRALATRQLGGVKISLTDGSSISVLEQKLDSPLPGEVIYCLNMLEEIEHESLDRFMLRLLSHPEVEVRLHVLKRIEALHMTSALDAVRKLADSDQTPEVRSRAIRTYCALAESDAFELVAGYLTEQDETVRKGAMIGLLRSGGIDGILSAGDDLNALLDSENVSDRRIAAEVLGEVGIESFYRPLIKLLQDENLAARRAAIVASGKLKNTKLVPQLLDNITVAGVSFTAFSALVEYGEAALPDLEGAFHKQGQTSSYRKRVVRICGRVGGRRASGFLKNEVDFPERDVRTSVLNALVRCDYRAPPEEADHIHDSIRREAQDATWALAALDELRDETDAARLADALGHQVSRDIERIFLLLSFIHPSTSILQARDNLESDSSDKRATALEALDNLISQDVKAIVFPLLEDLQTQQRLTRLSAAFPQQRLGRNQRIIEIITSPSESSSAWTRAVALHVLDRYLSPEFYDAIVHSLDDSDPMVRETAIWVLGRLSPEDLVERLQPLVHDQEKAVAEMARLVIHSVGLASLSVRASYLTRSGRYTSDFCARMLLDPEERRARRRRGAEILATLRDRTAKESLLQALQVPDESLRLTVLRGLLKGQFEFSRKEGSSFAQLLDHEVHRVERTLLCIDLLSNHEQTDEIALLRKSLIHELERGRERVFLLLMLIGGLPQGVFRSVQYWFLGESRGPTPASINELLGRIATTAFDQTQQRIDVGLLELENLTDLIKTIDKSSDDVPQDVESALESLAFDSDEWVGSWTRVCAMKATVALGLSHLAPRAEAALDDYDDVIREMAAWTLFHLDRAVFDQHVGQLRSDLSRTVSRLARELSSTESVDSPSS